MSRLKIPSNIKINHGNWCSARNTKFTISKRHYSSRRSPFDIAPNEELSFAVITPKSLAKARTGGIIARLFSTPGIEVVGSRMYAPNEAFQREWVNILKQTEAEELPEGAQHQYEEALVDYVANQLSKRQCFASGISNRLMLLLFKGQNCRKKLLDVIGDHIPTPEDYGHTVRGTYGEYFTLPDGNTIEFEPAVIAPTTQRSNLQSLALFAKYADSIGGVMAADSKEHQETALVMIKPDQLERASARPGHIIDLFGTTGLQLVGTKVFSMTLAQAQDFYGFLEEIFVEKLAPSIDKRLRQALPAVFDFPIDDKEYASITSVLKRKNAHSEVSKIIQYMTGVHPDTAKTEEEKHLPGPAKCFALLYRGNHAIELIRQKLGSTDPSRAEIGTIRLDYGRDLMRNGAHASDSPQSAERERKIVGLAGGEPSGEKVLIEHWLKTRSL